MSKRLTVTRLKNRICNSFWGALMVIGLSTLPYFHDIITTPDGLKSWVPILGIERLLTGQDTFLLGFSTYRVFLYTFLISLFSTLGYALWYLFAKNKYYRYALIGVLTSSVYHLCLLIFKLRRTVLNEPEMKLIGLSVLFLVLGFLSYRKYGITIRKVLVWCALYIFSILPFFHDIFKFGTTMGWIPNLGIEEMLTDSEGKVRGLTSYRLLLYLFGTYLFSHLGWIGSFFDSRGRKLRPFLLVPAVLSLYQVILIVMSWRETEFNSPSINLYITLVISILLAINFFYNNRFFAKTETIINNTPTIKSTANEN